jgi:hypothetical protein
LLPSLTAADENRFLGCSISLASMDYSCSKSLSPAFSQANEFSGNLPSPEAWNNLHIVHLAFNNFSSIIDGPVHVTDLSYAYNLE